MISRRIYAKTGGTAGGGPQQAGLFNNRPPRVRQSSIVITDYQALGHFPICFEGLQ